MTKGAIEKATLEADQVFPVLKNKKGQCVPHVAMSDKQPAVISRNRTLRAAQGRCCGSCGGPMGELVWFIQRRDALPFRFGPNGRRKFHFLETVEVKRDPNPPMHFECAVCTVSGGCPFMSAQQTVLVAAGKYTFEAGEDQVTFSARCVEARRLKR